MCTEHCIHTGLQIVMERSDTETYPEYVTQWGSTPSDKGGARSSRP